MKWIVLTLAVLVDADAAWQLLGCTSFLWPPLNGASVIGMAPRVLVAAGVLLSLIAFVFFIRVSGWRRFLALLPTCTLLFAALGAFFIWDHPRAWHRTNERIAADITARLDEQTARIERELCKQHEQHP